MDTFADKVGKMSKGELLEEGTYQFLNLITFCNLGTIAPMLAGASASEVVMLSKVIKNFNLIFKKEAELAKHFFEKHNLLEGYHTDVFYKSTKIPKSFELAVGSKKFWVAPNATDHMLEYITKAKNISHGMPINSQSLLSSFRSSVEKAIKSGIQYTKKPIIVDSWELMFSPPRQEGLLPVIKHALYKPKGF